MREEQPRPAELPPRLARLPVGLAQDRDAEPGRLQHPVQDRHREAGVIDVGVAGDEDDVDGVPAARRHLGAPSSAASGAAYRSCPERQRQPGCGSADIGLSGKPALYPGGTTSRSANDVKRSRQGQPADIRRSSSLLSITPSLALATGRGFHLPTTGTGSTGSSMSRVRFFGNVSSNHWLPFEHVVPRHRLAGVAPSGPGSPSTCCSATFFSSLSGLSSRIASIRSVCSCTYGPASPSAARAIACR